jgi:hypothetical protein
MLTIQTLDHVFNNDTFMVDAKLGEILRLKKAKEGWTNPFMLANEEAFPFNNSRNHQDLPIKELETIPHSTFDLDVFKVEIYYHKTQTIIMSFIGGKITYCNIAL